jgi:nitrate reductase gamma subunit
MKTVFVFETWPYVTVALFAAGITARYFVPSQPFDMRDFFSSTRLLLFSVLLVLLGHLAGLLFPQRILIWNSVPSRLYTFEALAFGVGLSALAGWARAMWQHLRASDGSIALQAGDALFLSLLFGTLLSGSLTAILFRWGSSWGVLTLTPYVASLVGGQPAAGLATGMPFLVRLHVFSAFATLAAFPATRFASVLLSVLRRGLAWTLTPVHRLADSVSGRVEVVTRRLNPAIWLWPEED